LCSTNTRRGCGGVAQMGCFWATDTRTPYGFYLQRSFVGRIPVFIRSIHVSEACLACFPRPPPPPPPPHRPQERAQEAGRTHLAQLADWRAKHAAATAQLEAAAHRAAHADAAAAALRAAPPRQMGARPPGSVGRPRESGFALAPVVNPTDSLASPFSPSPKVVCNPSLGRKKSVPQVWYTIFRAIRGTLLFTPKVNHCLKVGPAFGYNTFFFGSPHRFNECDSRTGAGGKRKSRPGSPPSSLIP